jgi:predicted lipoprotein with Yx(FWY)xxD motif
VDSGRAEGSQGGTFEPPQNRSGTLARTHCAALVEKVAKERNRSKNQEIPDMRPSSRWTSFAGIAVGAALIVAACSSAAATPTSAVLGATALPTTAGPAAASGVTIGSANSTTLGAYLTGKDGMTLYVFMADTADTSSCTGACSTNWPPLTVAPASTVTGPSGAMSTFGLISRADGTTQVTFNHMPLYYFAGDSAAGDTNGQGKLGKWFVAPLSGALPSSAPAAASSAPSPVGSPAQSMPYQY